MSPEYPAVQHDVDVSSLHTLALKGTADNFVDVESIEQAQQVLRSASSGRYDIIPFGDGSNLVFPSSGNYLWTRISNKGIRLLSEDQNSVLVEVMAGENWHELVMYCCERSWHGLENLALIPGRVGAAPIQNIGAYGVEVSEFIATVKGLNIVSGDPFELSARDCRFAYRDSVFKREKRDQCMITSVVFTLSKTFAPHCDYPSLREELLQSGVQQESMSAEQLISAVVSIRQRKLPDPAISPNAGSFFKNPIVDAGRFDHIRGRFPSAPAFESGDQFKLPAAWLIEQAGLKGFSSGALSMSERHALVLVHDLGSGERCDASAVSCFARKIIDGVFEQFGVTLEPEPRFYPEWDYTPPDVLSR